MKMFATLYDDQGEEIERLKQQIKRISENWTTFFVDCAELESYDEEIDDPMLVSKLSYDELIQIRDNFEKLLSAMEEKGIDMSDYI